MLYIANNTHMSYEYDYRCSPTWRREQDDRWRFEDDGNEYSGWYTEEELRDQSHSMFLDSIQVPVPGPDETKIAIKLLETKP